MPAAMRLALALAYKPSTFPSALRGFRKKRGAGERASSAVVQDQRLFALEQARYGGLVQRMLVVTTKDGESLRHPL